MVSNKFISPSTTLSKVFVYKQNTKIERQDSQSDFALIDYAYATKAKHSLRKPCEVINQVVDDAAGP